jgi:hypothetical protein
MMKMVKPLVVVSVHWPSSSTTDVKWFVGLARVITLGLLLMVCRYGQRAMEVRQMRNVLYCIKETAIVFAMVVMVMAAAAGGTYLLLHTL